MEPENKKNSVLWILSLSSFLMPMMSSSVFVALPAMGRELAMGAVLLGWVSAAFLLSSAVFQVPFGKIADIYGRKKIFIYGMIIYTISSLLASISPHWQYLIGMRIVQGFGSSMIFSTGLAILMSYYPPQDRGRIIGINIGSVYLGLSLGPIIGAVLTQYLGWRSLFWMNVPFGILILAFVLYSIKEEWTEAKGEKLDIPGIIVYALTLILIITGFSLVKNGSGSWMLITGVVGLVIFILIELRAANPVLDMKMFMNNKIFAYSNLAALINYMATAAIAYLMNLYLQDVRGFTPMESITILVAQPAMMAVTSPFTGRLSNKFSLRALASTGMALITIGLLLFVFVTPETNILLIIANMLLLGFGFGIFSSPNTNAVMSSVDKRLYGIASGVLGTMRNIGQNLSMGIAMLVISIIMGNVKITPDLHPQFMDSMHTAFIAFAALCVVGTFASYVRGKAEVNV